MQSTFAALFAEFIGTALLILLGNGVVANVLLPKTKGNGAGWVLIAFGWGMAVFVAGLCVGPISGAHINPAVTFGFWLTDRITFFLAVGYVIAQMLGAIAGAALVYWFYRDHYAASDDADAKLATFATSPAIRNFASNLSSEVIGTAVLVLAVLLAADPKIEFLNVPTTGAETSATLGLGALGALPVGLVVLAIGLSLGGTTGYAINPARDLGPRIAHEWLPIPGKRDGDWDYAMVPVVGPILGAVVAAILYWLL
jgi:glycerol uptake facilitator protein